ncbi:hypothetical protein SAMN05880582_10119 [Rhizobium sp. RU20A]|nr:hypothetical protein SAMN05880582_10119 [Rhizobium sp. RU20A]
MLGSSPSMTGSTVLPYWTTSYTHPACGCHLCLALAMIG